MLQFQMFLWLSKAGVSVPFHYFLIANLQYQRIHIRIFDIGRGSGKTIEKI